MTNGSIISVLETLGKETDDMLTKRYLSECVEKIRQHMAIGLPEPNEATIKLIEERKKFQAILEYRRAYACSMAEAKAKIDNYGCYLS